ncbi:MAG: hypothetical protein IJG36_12830, partial [Synergistaceae bacterium]|nr:hypothetical protein [Synergistaceae bacterium]
ELIPDEVRKALKQYTDIAHQPGNEAVLKAIQDEEQNMREINAEYLKWAKLLGHNMDGVFRNPHYYRHRIIEYAQAIRSGYRHQYSQGNLDVQEAVDNLMFETQGRSWLKKRKGSNLDFITNYMEANAEVRIQMLQDIETMKTLFQIKRDCDIAPKIRKKFNLAEPKIDNDVDGSESFSQSGDGQQDTILDHVPEGHEVFDINSWGGIEGNKSVYDNIVNMAVPLLAEEHHFPLDRIFEALGIEDSKSLMVIPSEIAETLRKMARVRQRGALAQAAKDFTTWWKRSVLFTPTRNLLYNIRNFTGDIDALIAGNPHALKFLPQSIKELVDYYMHNSKEGYSASQDLQDYIRLSGQLGIPSLNLSKADAQMLTDLLTLSDPKKLKKLGKKKGQKILDRIKGWKNDTQNNAEETDTSILKKAWQSKWNLIAKWFNFEHSFTEMREHLLRFAAYLDYKQQMESNQDGKPNNWGASLEDEVMAVKDIKERAFKMSNELLGAYDQVSEIGKQLRDMLIPFYSWMEVNMRRTWRLLRNGFKYGYGARQAKQLALGKLASMPLYTLSAAQSFGKLLLFTAALQMFNRFVFPEADDDLPYDVKYRPHLTLGKRNGQVYYFDRIGAIADAADWFHLDSIWLDAKDLANGQQTLGGYLKKMAQAPFSKAINGLNPALKMPIELAMGRSMFPDAFNPSTIRDPAEYIARSFGMSWPYKAITGKPHDNMQELTRLFVYSQDEDEAAYWQTLDRVRQFQNQVLDRHFDGFASTARGRILQNIKKALRFNDREAVRRFLREYTQANGTKQGLKASM